MANKIYNYEIPVEYSYDTNKILISGGIVSLKENLTDIYARWHLNEATGATVLDSSGNGRNGTPVNNPVSVTGKLNNCLSFNGTNQYVNCGNIANFEKTQPFSVGIWLKYIDGTLRGVMGNLNTLDVGRGWQIYIRSATSVGFQLRGGSGTNAIHVSVTCNTNDNNWHYIVFTYNGNSSASGINCYIDTIPQSITILANTLTTSIISNDPLSIAMANSLFFLGNLDEIVIYDKVLSQEEVIYRYNSGAGRENWYYYTDKPTIKPISSWNVSGLSQWFAFAETLGVGNQGNFGYQLSDDDGINWRYWNGSSWVITSDQYNSAAVIGANISTFPIINSKILFKAFLISDGTQQCKLDTIEITATVGNPPNVYAGANKSCRDHETKKPFSDAVISDPDGDIENATAYRRIESEIWTQILKGGYGTLQDAIRNFEYTFDNLGEITCELKIVDEELFENTDSMIETVSKYQVIFNIKDSDGNHLGNVLSYFDDGQGWQMKNSPFTYEFEWKSGNYLCTFDKTGFISQTINVLISDHTENITLQRLTVDPSAIADAVWDELKTGHTLTNSFGYNLQNLVPTVAEITNAIWGATTRTLTSFGSLVSSIWTNTIRTLTAGTKDSVIDEIKIQTDKIPNLDTQIKRVLGLTSENYRVTSFTYDGELLTAATIKIYSTKSDCINDTNAIAIYSMITTYDVDGKSTGYQVTKES